MIKSKWLTVAGVVLVANTVIVTLASVWRIAVADESPVAIVEQEKTSAGRIDQPTQPASQDDETNLLVELPPSVPGLSTTPTPATPNDANPNESAPDTTVPESPALAEVAGTSVIDRIDVPAELPEVPSLDHKEQFDQDPLMQELRSLFENRADAPQLEILAPNLKSDRSADYFETIDSRLNTVRLLTIAAQSIATEAEASSKKQQPSEKVDELLNMSAQLRSIAAKLLVSEP